MANFGPVKTSLSFETGYTKPDAPSIKELQAQVQFFGDQGAPWYMALFAEPRREGGSMIGTKEFYEFERFYKVNFFSVITRNTSAHSVF